MPRACSSCSSGVCGSLFVFAASLGFAVANSVGKAFEQSDGTVATLMFSRGSLAWLVNGLIAKVSGDSPATVMIFRGVRCRRVGLLLFNGGLNAVCVQLLFVALDMYVSFADSFVIIIGVYTVTSMALAVIGGAERVSRFEIVGGLTCLLGVAMVSQPSWLFGDAKPVDAFGMLLLVVAGVCVGAYNVGCRHLTQLGFSAGTVNSASLLALSIYATLTLCACPVFTSGRPPHWAQIQSPPTPLALLLVVSYCILRGDANPRFGPAESRVLRAQRSIFMEDGVLITSHLRPHHFTLARPNSELKLHLDPGVLLTLALAHHPIAYTP